MERQSFIDSRAEMEKLLEEEEYGYLGLADGGKPYVVPLNYHYRDGKIMFHCRFTGKKLDYLKLNPQVCFSVGRQCGRVRELALKDLCHLDSESVICYGTARIIEDLHERKRVMEEYRRRFRPGAGETTLEKMETCCVVEISISEMTGRQEKGRTETYWQHSFNGAGPQSA